MMEAAKSFRRPNAYKQLPALNAALLTHQASTRSQTGLRRTARPHNFPTGTARPAKFNKTRDIPPLRAC
jgi:hypothetical protein